MSVEDYCRIFSEQKGVCAICGIDPEHVVGPEKHKKLHVDHNHTNGKVRGLLCNGCNRALGLIGENISTARKIVEYLEKQKETTIIDDAKDLTLGERQKNYGHPIEDFGRVVGMINSLFAHKMNEPFEPKDWPLIMQCVKMSREINESKRDNRVDGAGYWNTLQLIHDRAETSGVQMVIEGKKRKGERG